jgi:DNA-binding NarL/FixJ family response regulator
MRVAITSSEQLFVDGLVAIFAAARFNVVAASNDCRDCVRSVIQAEIDVLVLDVRGLSRDEQCFVLGAELYGNFRTLVMTAVGDEMPAGFEFCVDVCGSGTDLVDKIRSLIAENGPRIPRRQGSQRVVTNGLQLSERQYELATLITKGYPNKRNAEEMALKEQSVKNLVSSVIRKLHCENRVQIALRLSQEPNLN